MKKEKGLPALIDEIVNLAGKAYILAKEQKQDPHALQPLPVRMRWAANVIDAVNRKAGEIDSMPPLDHEWNSSSLHRWAREWEKESHDNIVKGDDAEDIAKTVSKVLGRNWNDLSDGTRELYLKVADALVDAGYGKAKHNESEPPPLPLDRLAQ